MASITSIALILSLKPFQFSSQQHHNSNLRFLSHPSSRSFVSPTTVSCRRNRIVGCLVSDVGGGGLSDTRRSEFSREFAVIATMLKRIEPLDTSDICKGVSGSAKDSMKQTISTMLGLLPSDQFSVSVRVSKVPLHHLLVSSIITGYTLWNAEYRISLMRNFDLSMDNSETRNYYVGNEMSGLNFEEQGCEGAKTCIDLGINSPDQVTSHNLKDLSPEALRYIQHLEAELNSAKKDLLWELAYAHLRILFGYDINLLLAETTSSEEEELDAQRQDSVQMESNRGNNNNLLEYLRSLESSMVSELSQPSSIEVKEVIHELVQNTIQRFFKDDPISEPIESTAIASIKDHQFGDSERSEMVTTSRDYLAKLLFWCMLLGHHLRGLENRLHLSCVVGLL